MGSTEQRRAVTTSSVQAAQRPIVLNGGCLLRSTSHGVLHAARAGADGSSTCCAVVSSTRAAVHFSDSQVLGRLLLGQCSRVELERTRRCW
jgi:uncharacterized heparinase superfamily protein